MTQVSDAEWLEEAARYFENRSTGGEDMAFWANVSNAERCRSIAQSLRSQPEPAGVVKGLVDYLWQEICELPDRTSPEEYPDMGMVTLSELTAIVETYADLSALTEQQGEADPVGYIRPETLAKLREGDAGPIVGVAAYDTTIPLYAAPDPKGYDHGEVEAVRLKLSEALYGKGNDRGDPLSSVADAMVSFAEMMVNALNPREETAGVVVKPLEWSEYHPGCFTASAAGHYYTVETGNGEDDENEDRWYYDDREYTSENLAKAVAEADHCQRILSALSAPQQQKGEVASQSVTDAARDVLAERQRQVEAEGWTAEHDDEHDEGQMTMAAVTYILACGVREDRHHHLVHRWWPWAFSWWKPAAPRRMLVKAAALILAEIERLDRAALTAALSQTQGE